MSDAIVEDTKIEIDANDYRFQLDGQKLFMMVSYVFTKKRS